MSNFCEQCGEKLEPNENFCPFCGAEVIRDEPEPSPKPAPTPPSSPTVFDNSFGTVIAWIFSGIGIIFLIIIVIAGSSAQKSTSERYDSPPATSESSDTRNVTYDTKPAPPAALIESDFKIGDAELGVLKSYVDREFGAGKPKSDGWYDYGSFWAKFDSSGSVSWISCMNANLATPRGIHVGSTLAELEKAYNLNQFQKDIATNTVNYEGELNDIILVFSVLKRSNTVDEIILVRKNKEPQSPPPPSKSNTPSDEYNHTFTVNGDATYKGINRHGLACALYKVDYQKHIFSDFGFNHTAQGTFYIVTAILGNNTLEPLSFTSIYLIDERGRKFSADINVSSTWRVMHNVDSILTLNPGQACFDYEVFDVPDNVKITHLRCEGFVGINSVEFDIPFRVVKE